MKSVTNECKKHLFLDRNPEKLSHLFTSNFELHYRNLTTANKEAVLGAVKVYFGKVVEVDECTWNCIDEKISGLAEWSVFTKQKVRPDDSKGVDVYTFIFSAQVKFERTDGKVQISSCRVWDYAQAKISGDSETKELSWLTSSLNWLTFS